MTIKKEEQPTLFGFSSTNKLKMFKAWAEVDEDTGIASLCREYGYVDGKKQVKSKPIKGKNIGKANETTPYDQAIFDSKSKWNKKIDEGYVENIEDFGKSETVLPMLAHKYIERSHKVVWPAQAQPKLNGVRCVTRPKDDGVFFQTRKGKEYTTMGHLTPAILEIQALGIDLPDGELFNEDFSLERISAAVKKFNKDTPSIQMWIYDYVDNTQSNEKRSYNLSMAFDTLIRRNPSKGSEIDVGGITCQCYGGLVCVPTIEITDDADMHKWHDIFASAGYEGIIIRNKNGLYSIGHRTVDLLKFKHFIDDEFVIIGGEEATGDDAGTVVFICKTKEGKTFNVRPKGTRPRRRQYFEQLDELIGKELTVRYQNLSDYGIPIFPVGIVIRDYE